MFNLFHINEFTWLSCWNQIVAYNLRNLCETKIDSKHKICKAHPTQAQPPTTLEYIPTHRSALVTIDQNFDNHFVATHKRKMLDWDFCTNDEQNCYRNKHTHTQIAKDLSKINSAELETFITIAMDCNMWNVIEHRIHSFH